MWVLPKNPGFQSAPSKEVKEEVLVTKVLGTQKKEPANLGTWRDLEISWRR